MRFVYRALALLLLGTVYLPLTLLVLLSLLMETLSRLIDHFLDTPFMNKVVTPTRYLWKKGSPGARL